MQEEEQREETEQQEEEGSSSQEEQPGARPLLQQQGLRPAARQQAGSVCSQILLLGGLVGLLLALGLGSQLSFDAGLAARDEGWQPEVWDEEWGTHLDRQRELAGAGEATCAGDGAAGAARELQQAQQGQQPYERVVAIGDLHGDLDQGRAALRLMGIVNQAGNWTAGRTLLVQMGDLVDRGHHSLDLLDLFHRLGEEAAAAGGRVVTLLGNHEMMLLEGDLRYFSRQELRRLGAQMVAEAEAARGRRLAGAAGSQPADGGRGQEQGQLPGDGDPQRELQQQQEGQPQGGRPQASPQLEVQLGTQLLAQLLSPQGRYGEQIRRRPLAFLAGPSLVPEACTALFVHAGAASLLGDAAAPLTAPPSSAGPSTRASSPQLLVDVWNAAGQRALRNCTTGPCGARAARAGWNGSRLAATLLSQDGLVWSRLYMKPDEKVCPDVERLLRTLGVRRIVVGHTIQRAVRPRCGGRLLMVDVGMSRALMGTPATGIICGAGAYDQAGQQAAAAAAGASYAIRQLQA